MSDINIYEHLDRLTDFIEELMNIYPHIPQENIALRHWSKNAELLLKELGVIE